jgi:iron complex transport system permease protein
MVALSPPLARRRLPGFTLTLALTGLVLAAALLSLTSGAAGLGPGDILAAAMGEGLSLRDQVVLFDIRLPRLALGLAVGAALAVSGVLLQGLFRNPLADPGIVGVSAGAGLGAVLAIVLGGLLPVAVTAAVGSALVPLAAGLGGWLTTLLLYRVASSGQRTDVALMLLAGIALGALAGAATGHAYLPRQRSATARSDVLVHGLAGRGNMGQDRRRPATDGRRPDLVAPRLARGLNSLALGEAQAAHMGIDVQVLKRLAIFSAAAASRGSRGGRRRHRLCRPCRSAPPASATGGRSPRALMPAMRRFLARTLLILPQTSSHAPSSLLRSFPSAS